jgi:hypothetical protein
MLLTMGLIGTPALCIFRSPYSLGGLEPDGRSCLHKSFLREDFLAKVQFPVCRFSRITGQTSIGWVFKEGRNLLFVVSSVENTVLTIKT